MAQIRKVGRNISPANLKEIFDFIDNFVPETPQQKRDLVILKYAYVDNMSAQAIARLHDRRLVCLGNRRSYKNDGYLTGEYIAKIIASYGLVHEKRKDYTTVKNYERRKKLTQEREKGIIGKPNICGCCGSTERLELHHIIPMAEGGTEDFYNLLYLCHDCHMKITQTWRKRRATA